MLVIWERERFDPITKSRLTKACEAEFEAYVEQLFEHPRMVTRFSADIPVIGGGWYMPDQYDRFANRELHQLAVAALIARERFRLDWPDWPALPVNRDRFEDLQDDDDLRLRLAAYFGESLSWLEPVAFAYDEHPKFPEFVSGLMAYESTPSELRDDRELQAEFPPRPLEGLTDGFMTWRTPEMIERSRDMARRVAAYEAAMWGS